MCMVRIRMEPPLASQVSSAHIKKKAKNDNKTPQKTTNQPNKDSKTQPPT